MEELAGDRPGPPPLYLPLPPDDLLLEILLRLPPEPIYLFRASFVSKHWRSLVHDARFLRRFREFHVGTPPVLGFFNNQLEHPLFVPTSGGFALSTATMSHDDWWALDCRHGRALLERLGSGKLLVWDLLTGDERHLPAPPACDGMYNDTVLCAAGHTVHGDCRSCPFLVVYVFSRSSSAICACVLSSDTGVWSEVTSIDASSNIQYRVLCSLPPFGFLGCGIGVYLYHPDTGDLVGHCTIKCTSMASLLLVTEGGGICNGMGCCTVTFPVAFRGFRVTIVKNNETVPQPFANITIKAFLSFRPYIFSIADLLSDKINASTVGASSAAYLSTVITDKPNCAKARSDDKTRYACGSSNCENVANGGYYCTCSSSSDDGNPYILDDCKQEYNHTPKMNCSRSCGSTNVPFPFGFEPGCYATRRFQLNCASNRTLIGRPPVKYEVTNISLDDGLLYVNKLSEFEDANMNYLSIYYGGSGYFGQQLVYGLDKSDLSEEFGVWRWSAANLTCESAKKDRAYACRSANSECIGVTHGKLYIGYRCKCSPGFEGNPYVENGCTDIDECLIPNNCNGTCYNLKGSFRCCPHDMFFDPVEKQCTPDKRQNLILGVSTGIGSGFGVLALALGAIILMRRLKRGAQRKIRRAFFRKNKGLLLEQLISSTSESVTHSTRIFSMEELEKATNNFDPTRVLGHGGHGTVYKGILSDQRVVAIKKSKMVEQSEIDQFVNEVSILSQIIHRNVVKLFGCCLESEVPLLVYEFISNGTLHDLLHGDPDAKCLLTWDDRIRVALEAAGALAYLHSSAAMPIFHRDVKSANILLDDTFTTKVSDFGASRSISIDQTHVVTIVQGTFGYLDPEYYYTGQLTEKSDVYSFGVILVELLTRKKPIFLNSLGEQQNLCHYFLGRLKDETVMDIIDSQVVEEASQSEIDEMASVAAMCLRTRGGQRPKMKEVELRLQLLRARRRPPRRHEQELQRHGETKPLLSTPIKSRSTSVAMAKNVELGIVADNPPSRILTRCYSMEQEMAASSEFPR
ncbi:wall-associated receptor kinase 3-like [Triticum dicoccoides]|uniref:wall-associated receptor kinase 3-like n=1 Tax=Triticum dicoccoides TaxID=85692 RepID=UPI00188DCE2D|nr:wall-associated receptor kinase 3-like [Triticum dicoccoides]